MSVIIVNPVPAPEPTVEVIDGVEVVIARL